MKLKHILCSVLFAHQLKDTDLCPLSHGLGLQTKSSGSKRFMPSASMLVAEKTSPAPITSGNSRSLVFAEGLHPSSLLLCTVSPGMLHEKIAGLLCSTVSQWKVRTFHMYTFPTPIKPYLVNHNPSLHSNT